jgi:alpha-ketoglutarate-dependent taurine dioxygenase
MNDPVDNFGMFGVAPPGLGQNRPWRPDQVLTNFVWERAERCVELEGRCREEISAAAAAVAAVPTVTAAGRNGQPIPRTKRPEDVARLIEQHGVVVLDLSHELAGAIAQARALDPTGKSPAASDYQQQSALAQARAAARGGGSANPFKVACDELPRRIWGADILTEGSAQEAPSFVAAQNKFNHCHTDGKGDKDGDILMLLCETQADEGGANIFVDGYAVLEQLAQDERTSWVVGALESQAVDIRDMPDEPTQSTRPLAQRVPSSGRLAVLSLPPLLKYVNPSVQSADPERDLEMLRLWATAIRRAELETERVRLRPGEVAIIDNYRCFHARETFSMAPTPRVLWQKHVWTVSSFGHPEPTTGQQYERQQARLREGSIGKPSSSAAAADVGGGGGSASPRL